MAREDKEKGRGVHQYHNKVLDVGHVVMVVTIGKDTEDESADIEGAVDEEGVREVMNG